jgi:dienelactone hydrolase
LKELLVYLTENRPEGTPPNLIAGKPGLLGFGKGATNALKTLAETPDNLAAIVLYNPVGESQEIATNVPILLHWSENDPEIDKTWPERLRSRAHIGQITTTSYQGVGHDFANPASPDYSRTVAEWAWVDTLKWLNRLKQQPK